MPWQGRPTRRTTWSSAPHVDPTINLTDIVPRREESIVRELRPSGTARLLYKWTWVHYTYSTRTYLRYRTVNIHLVHMSISICVCMHNCAYVHVCIHVFITAWCDAT